MKKTNLKNSLLVGLSLLCLMYAGAVQAEQRKVQYPPVQINGLSKYSGKYISIFYVTAGDAHLLTVNNKLIYNLKIVEENLVITKQISEDSISLDSQLAPQKGAHAPNAIEFVIHDSPQFSIMKSETQYGLSEDGIAEFELPNNKMFERMSNEKSSIFNVYSNDFL